MIIGTAAMGRLNSAPAIRSFITKCIMAGFTSFDTAPLYGSGIMESMLAKALGHVNPQQDLRVNTKFGLYTPRSLAFLDGAYLLKKSAMALVKRIPGSSGYAASQATLLETARRSLDSSLRHFGKGRIDVFFAHEVPIGQLMTPDFLDFIRESKRNDCFKRFGLGGYRSQYSGGGNDEFWDCVDVIQVESHPGQPLPRPAGWDGAVFLHGVVSKIKTDPVGTPAANSLRLLIEEAFEAQGADNVVVGISRESHLVELTNALPLQDENRR